MKYHCNGEKMKYIGKYLRFLGFFRNHRKQNPTRGKMNKQQASVFIGFFQSQFKKVLFFCYRREISENLPNPFPPMKKGGGRITSCLFSLSARWLPTPDILPCGCGVGGGFRGRLRVGLQHAVTSGGPSGSHTFIDVLPFRNFYLKALWRRGYLAQ